MDHEGEVGKGSQHEGWDETGGYVVAWLANKVDDHLKRGIFFNVSQPKFILDINRPFWCLCFLLHQRWCSC